MVAEALWTIAVVTVGALLLQGVGTQRRWRRWERDRRQELESYCTLEMALPTQGDPRKRIEKAKRLARLVTQRSIFPRCVVFLPDETGRLNCTGSCGVDDLSLAALEAWCERCLREESSGIAQSEERFSVGARRSVLVSLALAGGELMPDGACETATLVPIRLQRGRLIGLLAVCGSREKRLSSARAEEALVPLELLAAKLARTLERAMLMDRLMQVERLAGAAQLAARVAESLAEPLRAVLDRAELIAGTTNDARTREHAEAIAGDVEQMSGTLSILRDAWRPREEIAATVPEGTA